MNIENNIDKTDTSVIDATTVTGKKGKPYRLEFTNFTGMASLDYANINYHLKLNGFYRACLTTSPTGDCQTYSIGNICEILQLSGYMDILKEIDSRANKNQLLVNIIDNTRPNDIFKEIFKDNIVIHQLYESTNRTMMNMYLVKTQLLKDYKSEYQ